MTPGPAYRPCGNPLCSRLAGPGSLSPTVSGRPATVPATTGPS
jgi:hypothetical protein